LRNWPDFRAKKLGAQTTAGPFLKDLGGVFGALLAIFRHQNLSGLGCVVDRKFSLPADIENV
jgi:hypothetical protein